MRDYAKKSFNSPAHKKHTTKRRSRSTAKTRDNKSFWKVWAGSLLVVIVALVAAQMFYKHYMKEKQLAANQAKISTLNASNSKTTTAGSPITQLSKVDTATQAKPIAQKPQFDFYNVLPESSPSTAPTQTVDSSTTSNPTPRSFMLQVASYRAQNDAKAMQARLLLLGLQPIVKSTQSGWYRVDIGPFETKRAADVVRHQIQKAGINGSLTRQIS